MDSKERDRLRAYRKTEKYRAWAKLYYARPDVKERRRAVLQRSAKKNREKRYADTRKWNQTDHGKEWRKQYGKAWRAANADKCREYDRRKNEKRKAKRAPLTTAVTARVGFSP